MQLFIKSLRFLVSFGLFYTVLIIITHIYSEIGFDQILLTGYLLSAIFFSACCTKKYWIASIIFGVGTWIGFIVHWMILDQQEPYFTMKAGMVAEIAQIIAFVAAIVIQTVWNKISKEYKNRRHGD